MRRTSLNGEHFGRHFGVHFCGEHPCDPRPLLRLSDSSEFVRTRFRFRGQDPLGPRVSIMSEILEAVSAALTRNYFLRIIKARLMPHRGADWTK